MKRVNFKIHRTILFLCILSGSLFSESLLAAQYWGITDTKLPYIAMVRAQARGAVVIYNPDTCEEIGTACGFFIDHASAHAHLNHVLLPPEAYTTMSEDQADCWVAKNGKPLIGVVYDPVEQDLYHAIDGSGAYKNKQLIHLPGLDPDRPLILHTDFSFEAHPWFDKTSTGLQHIAQSLGLKGAAIKFKTGAAMNACNILQQPNSCYFKYPRKGNSGGSIWDFAATACLFNEAGAIASDIFGQPMELNRIGSTYMNHRGSLYAGQKKLADEIIELYKKLR